MTRRGFLKGLAASFIAGTLAALWGFVVEPFVRTRVRRWTVTTPKWTGKPLTMAIISDLHTGDPYVTVERLRKLVTRTNALGADVVLLLGDYAAGHTFITADVPPEDYADALSGLNAPLGVYSILGNHDWWDDPAAQARRRGPVVAQIALEARGIRILENDALRLGGDDGFWLAGLGDQLALVEAPGRYTGIDDLPGTLAQVTDDAPVVLMAHEPDIFPTVPDRVSLTLSGHTHGGQVRLFGWSPVVPSRYGNRFAYGHVREDGRDLVVSGGIGCSIAPVRFGVTPEITVVSISA